MKKQLQDHAVFAYSRDLEYIAVAAALMSDRLDGHLCREVYGPAVIAELKRKNRGLAEVLNSLWLGGLETAEFLMSYPLETSSLAAYKAYLKELPDDRFIYQFFGYRASLEETAAALHDDSLLAALMDEGKFKITSFVNLKSLITARGSFLDDYFSFLDVVRTPELEAYLDRFEAALPQLESEITRMLAGKRPYEAAQELRNNCFPEEDSYETYIFMPVCMLPRDAVLYFEKNLYILYSRTRIANRQKSLAILKAVSDETRMRIIDLLSERGKENGRGIASWMHLSPPTVSHHMDQLISCGIVKEEKIGAAKYYIVDRDAGLLFIEELEGILLKNLDHI
jgi:DNA-binding transcriptional ArsR family regulator